MSQQKIGGYSVLPKAERPTRQKLSEEQLKKRYGDRWQMYEEREGVNWDNVRQVTYYGK